jgi:glycosyltransferase involved in cell wall biosynthesis
LAEAILTLYRNRKLAARLGMEGYLHVHAHFSAKATAAMTVKVYKKLAARKGVRLDHEG